MPGRGRRRRQPDRGRAWSNRVSTRCGGAACSFGGSADGKGILHSCFSEGPVALSYRVAGLDRQDWFRFGPVIAHDHRFGASGQLMLFGSQRRGQQQEVISDAKSQVEPPELTWKPDVVYCSVAKRQVTINGVRIVSALVPDTTSRLGSPAKLWGGPPDSPFVSELTVIHAREADGGVGCGPRS